MDWRYRDCIASEFRLILDRVNNIELANLRSPIDRIGAVKNVLNRIGEVGDLFRIGSVGSAEPSMVIKSTIIVFF